MASFHYKFKPFEFLPNTTSKLSENRKFLQADHRVVCNDKYLYKYIPGHISDEYSPVQATKETEYNEGPLWKYHLLAGRWKAIKCKNLPRYFKFTSTLLSKNMVIIFGGRICEFDNKTISYQTFIGSLLNDHQDNGINFEEISSTNEIPKNGYGQRVVMSDNYLYTVNRRSIFEKFDVYKLDLNKKKWEILHQTHYNNLNPNTKLNHEIIFHNKRLFILSYDNNNHSKLHNFKKMYVFDLISNEWHYIDVFPDNTSSKYPEYRMNYALAQDMTQTEYVYMCSGYSMKGFLADFWRLNLTTLEWYNVNSYSIPKPTMFHLLTITSSGYMYYLDGLHCLRLGSVQLQQNRYIWTACIKIPKLSAICWDAVLYYFKDRMLAASEKNLKKIKIPSKYIIELIEAKKFLQT